MLEDMQLLGTESNGGGGEEVDSDAKPMGEASASTHWDCDVCAKSFRSEKQLENHCGSKRHAENVKRAAREEALEMLACGLTEEDLAAAPSGDEEQSNGVIGGDADDRDERDAGIQAAVTARRSDGESYTELSALQDEAPRGHTLSKRERRKQKQREALLQASQKIRFADIDTEAGNEEFCSNLSEDKARKDADRCVQFDIPENMLQPVHADPPDSPQNAGSAESAKKLSKAKLKKQQRRLAAEQAAGKGAEQGAKLDSRQVTGRDNPSAALEPTCSTCHQSFPSRTKLHAHLARTGHATLKPTH